MDLCQFTNDEEERWGVLSAQLLRANGIGAPGPLQVGVMEQLGSVVPAVKNSTMAIMSSGEARGVNDLVTPAIKKRDDKFRNGECPLCVFNSQRW